MKKALMILLFCAMLTGCGNSDKEAMTVTTAVSHETVTTTTAAYVSETTELTTTEISAENTDATAGKTSTSKTTKRSVTTARETGTATRTVTESTVSSQTDPERISETEMPKTTAESRQTTAAMPAVTTTTRSATTTTTTTTTSKPKQSVSEKPKETAATTTTTATTAAPSGIKWSDSMKVWRKLCEGKNLTAGEQEQIRTEILDYAVTSFNGQKDIHVSFGIDSYDISYEKPLNLKANKNMTSMSNAHMDAYADPNFKELIDYASSEKEIYEIVSDTRQSCLHIIDHGLFNRWELFTINSSLKYASDIEFGIGFDEDMTIWFLTQD